MLCPRGATPGCVTHRFGPAANTARTMMCSLMIQGGAGVIGDLEVAFGIAPAAR
jgi:hypothetical protein